MVLRPRQWVAVVAAVLPILTGCTGEWWRRPRPAGRIRCRGGRVWSPTDDRRRAGRRRPPVLRTSVPGAGTSAAGFDCSGFAAALYGVHGIALPRDADDQAGLGAPVDPWGAMMIQAPATGRVVATVPVDTPAYAREFWGARRYVS